MERTVQRWWKLWSVGDVLLPMPSVRFRRTLFALAAMSVVLIATSGWQGFSASHHFALPPAKGTLVYLYTLLAAAFLGGMGLRQPLLSAPSSLLVPVTSSLLVAAGVAVMLSGRWPCGSPSCLVALLGLQLVSLPFAARTWGLGFAARTSGQTALVGIAATLLLAYHALLIALAQAFGTVLSAAAMSADAVANASS